MNDPRQTLARPDLAVAGLRGQVSAARFAETVRRQVAVPVLDLTMRPGGGLATQLLLGELFDVLDEADGLAWGQSVLDGYVGYVDAGALSDPAAPTHRISVPLTHRYPEPDLKTRPIGQIPFRAGVAGQAGPEFLALDEGGFCPMPHVVPVAEAAAQDAVAVAAQFLHLPYLWGGRSALGLDCSALVQLSLQATGNLPPRDSDQQETLGAPVLGPLQRGDLIFWKGHVGLMADADTLLHATAHGMRVRTEPLTQVTERIAAAGYGPITAQRRLG